MYLLALFTGLSVLVDIVILPRPEISARNFVSGFVPSKVAPTSRIVMERLQNLLLLLFIIYPLSFALHRLLLPIFVLQIEQDSIL